MRSARCWMQTKNFASASFVGLLSKWLMPSGGDNFWGAPAERSDDGALVDGHNYLNKVIHSGLIQSGVALRPPQRGCRAGDPGRLPPHSKVEPMRFILISLLKFYQTVISPWLPPSCRFVPTCSEYAREAIERHGVLRGGRMSVWRLLRCQPFCPGGYDPVK